MQIYIDNINPWVQVYELVFVDDVLQHVHERVNVKLEPETKIKSDE